MTSNICFICLDYTPNKVCGTCECYAHPKCWGKYIQNNIEISTLIFNNFYEIISRINCPICKTINNNAKLLTRNDTILPRMAMLNLEIIFNLEIVTNDNEDIIYDNIFKIIDENKNLIKKCESLDNFVQKKLINLYNDGWKKANIHHLKIYGKQITI